MKKILVMLVCCTLLAGWNALAFEQDQVQIHGFASQGYLRSNHYDYLLAETEKGTVEYNEFGLNVISNLSDRLRLGIQLLARDLGDSGNDELTIDWAFGDYRYRNWAGLRVGKLKRAMGLYNQSRDIDAARIGVFLPLSVYDEAFRHFQGSVIGIEAYGTLRGGFEYQMQYGTLDPEVESQSLANPGVERADAGDDGYALRLGWDTPLDGLRVVGSLNTFSWTQEIIGGRIVELDAELPLLGFEYSLGNLTAAAEYFHLKLNRNGQEVMTSEYYYGLLGYRFTEWLEVGTSYAVLYQDKDDQKGSRYEALGMPGALAWRKDLALSARVDVNEFWVLKLEGHWMNGLFGVSNYGEDPDENGFLGAAKVTFSF